MKNYLKKKLNKKGFTLIELIVVIAILAILALILVPSISNYVAEANKSKDEANVRSVYSQLTAEVAMATTDNGSKGTVAVPAKNTKWAFEVVNKVAKDRSSAVIPATAKGVPAGMTVTYAIKNGVVTEFKAVINSRTFTANPAGEITATP